MVPQNQSTTNIIVRMALRQQMPDSDFHDAHQAQVYITVQASHRKFRLRPDPSPVTTRP